MIDKLSFCVNTETNASLYNNASAHICTFGMFCMSYSQQQQPCQLHNGQLYLSSNVLDCNQLQCSSVLHQFDFALASRTQLSNPLIFRKMRATITLFRAQAPAHAQLIKGTKQTLCSGYTQALRGCFDVWLPVLQAPAAQQFLCVGASTGMGTAFLRAPLHVRQEQFQLIC